jgi:dTDP-4-amino-4,6-dideoxygalactose transaminase
VYSLFVKEENEVLDMIQFYKGNLGSFINDSLEDVISSGMVTNYGKYYTELTKRVEDYLYPYHVTLVASGTHALTLSLLALKNTGRLPEHARILVPSFTFIASVQAILLAGMTPVFADIYSDDWTIDINANTDSYDAVMPVNIFGVQPYIPNEIPTVPDLSHGFGGKWMNCKNGTEGTICAFSTSVTKPFHTIEGGIVASEDKELVREVSSMSRWCLTDKYDCTGIGQWSKMSELHAIAGIESIKGLRSAIEYKHILANWYRESLKSLPIQFQAISEQCYSTYKDFGILVPLKTREKVIKALEENSIGYKLYFSPAIHETTYFKKTYPKVSLPVTEDISSRIICLPIHQDISINDIDMIADIIQGCF